jgi:uncharacterized protein
MEAEATCLGPKTKEMTRSGLNGIRQKQQRMRKSMALHSMKLKPSSADSRSLDIYDPDHSRQEDRFVKLGKSARGRLLVVVYTERRSQMRIISARRANRREKERHERES